MRALLGLALALTAAAQEVPQWVRDAAAAPVPQYPAKAAQVVLLSEEQLTIDAEGRRVYRERQAVKILQRQHDSVTAYRSYNSKTGRIREFRGWLLQPGAKDVAYGKSEVLDFALSQGATYTESRAQSLQCSKDVPAGSVFAFEIVEEERTVFVQHQYFFQWRAPALVSRFILSLPPGWEARSQTFNHPDIQAAGAAGALTWELRNLPYIEDEDYAPDLTTIVPRLAVTCLPPGDRQAQLPLLKDWAGVSAWLSGFSEGPAEVTPAVKSKAAELTGAALSKLDAIKALAAFVQRTNYVSIQMNLTKGGGYTPRPAEAVLNTNFGDCKDKTTLLRALLKAAGLDSHTVAIFSGDRNYVRPEFPSPSQFNHAIIAIRVPAEINLPAVFEHPKLGRLLPFDPTDEFTPVGDLPDQLQGSYGLIVAGDHGDLVALPRPPAADHRVEYASEGQLGLDGRLQARVTRHYFGQRAARMRSTLRDMPPDRVRKFFEDGLQGQFGGVTLQKYTPADDAANGRYRVDLEFIVEQFGQLTMGRLLILKPAKLGRVGGWGFPGKPRTLPVEFQASFSRDTVRVKVPPGFAVDELPDPVRRESPYGVYQAEYKAKDGEVTLEQSLEIKDVVAPAADYAKVREFFGIVGGGSDAAVVLVKR